MASSSFLSSMASNSMIPSTDEDFEDPCETELEEWCKSMAKEDAICENSNSPAEGGNQAMESTPDEQPIEKGEAKVTHKQRKNVFRPDRAYTREHIDLDSTEMFKESLQEASTYHIFNLTSKGQGVKQLASGVLLLDHHCDPVKAFLKEAAECFHAVLLADKGRLGKNANTELLSAFHAMLLREKLKTLWSGLVALTSMTNVDSQSQHILFTFSMRKWLEKLLTARNKAEAPPLQLAQVKQFVTPEEEQTVRYVSGYIPYALLQSLKRRSDEQSVILVNTLRQWQSTENAVHPNATNLLQYTSKWIDAINRGGLYKPKDSIFKFFLTAEIVAKSTLNEIDCNGIRGINIQNTLYSAIESNRMVNAAWNNLTLPAESKLQTVLYNAVLNKWSALRCSAFVHTYAFLLSKKASTVNAKGEKALRKNLRANKE